MGKSLPKPPPHVPLDEACPLRSKGCWQETGRGGGGPVSRTRSGVSDPAISSV